MAIAFATCPECRTTLKSTRPAGFAAGEALECPKCGTYFAAEAASPAKPVAAKPVSAKPAAPARPRAVEVDDEDEDDRPRKKKAKARAVVDDEDDEDLDEPPRKRGNKSKRRDDGGGSYRTSPLRFIILGILVVVMLVLAYFLYQKWQREKEDNAAAPTSLDAV